MQSDVRRVRLAEIAALVPNAIAAGPFGSNLVSRDYVESGVPVIRGQNLFGRWVAGEFVFVTSTKAEQLRSNTAKPGDIVFTQRGTLGQVSVVPATPFGSYVVSQSQMKLTVDHSAADPRYVYYACTAPDFVAQVHNNAVAAGVPHINLGILRKLEISLPPMPMQVMAADVLAALDDRIDLLRQTNATLEAIAQALFKSWFIDFDPVRAKAEGREPEGMDAATAALFPDTFEESALGLIPRGWRAAALEDIAKVVKGRSYKSSELADSNTALVTLKSFERGGGFRLDGFKSFTGAYKPEQVVQPGECVVAYTDVTQQAEVIGRAALVLPSREHGTLVASLDVGIVRPLSAAASPLFLYSLLRGERYVSHIHGFTSGTTVLHLAKDGLPTFSFALPTTPLVEAFTEIASALWLRALHNERMKLELSELRDTLLPRLISGKLRLPEARELVDATPA